MPAPDLLVHHSAMQTTVKINEEREQGREGGKLKEEEGSRIGIIVQISDIHVPF